MKMKRAQNLSVSQSVSQSVSRRLYKLYPLILFILAWLASTFLAFKYGKTLLDSDMASEMVLADLLNKEGKIISTNWYYSTEIRIIGQFLLFKPLLKLFPDNWYLVRGIAQCILILLTGLSYVYMMSAVGKREKNLLFAAMAMCPFGFFQMWFGSFSGFYFIWIAAFTFCGGLILRYALGKGKYRSLQLIFLTMLSFFIGMQSIRGLLNLQLPMLFAGLAVWYLHSSNPVLPEESRTQIKKFLQAAFLSCFFSIVGYGYNSLSLSHSYSFLNQNDKFWQSFNYARCLTVLEDFLKLWGYPYQLFANLRISLFSVNGILSCFGFLLTILCLLGFFILLRNIKKASVERQILGITCFSMILIPFFVFVLFQQSSNGSYFMPGMCFFLAGIQMAYEKFPYRLKNGRQLLSTVFFVCVILSSINTTSLFVQNPQRSYNQMPVIADLLEEQGYTQSVGTFWSSNVVTELTNGTVNSWTVEDFNSKKLYRWLQSKKNVENPPKGRCALIFLKEEYESLGYDLLSMEGVSSIYMDEKFIVIGMEHIEEWWT